MKSIMHLARQHAPLKKINNNLLPTYLTSILGFFLFNCIIPVVYWTDEYLMSQQDFKNSISHYYLE